MESKALLWVPEWSRSLVSRHRLHGLIKEDTHHAAFISSHCQLSKAAAIRHWRGPALPEGLYQISSSRPREAEVEVLEGGRVLLLPRLQCICVSVLQLEMEEEDSVAENRSICP